MYSKTLFGKLYKLEVVLLGGFAVTCSVTVPNFVDCGVPVVLDVLVVPVVLVVLNILVVLKVLVGPRVVFVVTAVFVVLGVTT